MDSLIQLVIYIVVFAIVTWGLLEICNRFGLPQPVKWVVGALLLIIALLFLSGKLGSGTHVFPRIR